MRKVEDALSTSLKLYYLRLLLQHSDRKHIFEEKKTEMARGNENREIMLQACK